MRRFLWRLVGVPKWLTPERVPHIDAILFGELYEVTHQPSDPRDPMCTCAYHGLKFRKGGKQYSMLWRMNDRGAV